MSVPLERGTGKAEMPSLIINITDSDGCDVHVVR